MSLASEDYPSLPTPSKMRSNQQLQQNTSWIVYPYLCTSACSSTGSGLGALPNMYKAICRAWRHTSGNAYTSWAGFSWPQMLHLIWGISSPAFSISPTIFSTSALILLSFFFITLLSYYIRLVVGYNTI